MKKVLLSLVLIGLLAVPAIASAGIFDYFLGTGGEQPEVAPTLDIMIVLNSVVDWLFAILLVVAAIWIIAAGYFFVTAAGDPDKTKKARDFVLYAVIGVLVGFAAKGLVALVGRIIGPAVM